jgi:hypothetical protein
MPVRAGSHEVTVSARAVDSGTALAVAVPVVVAAEVVAAVEVVVAVAVAAEVRIMGGAATCGMVSVTAAADATTLTGDVTASARVVGGEVAEEIPETLIRTTGGARTAT